jgi:hypothetical protein
MLMELPKLIQLITLACKMEPETATPHTDSALPTRA